MNKKKLLLISLLLVICLSLSLSSVADNTNALAKAQPDRMQQYESYKSVVKKTVNMVRDREARKIAKEFGLNILNVTWEDTGRYKGSSVGPNISDMTIQVQLMNPKTEKYRLFCMPVIRFPNFSDKTCDVKPENFHMLVGNEKGKPLKKINLKEFLADVRSHLSKPESWKGNDKSLLAKRDTHVLVSAQACFLPIPKQGIATFNPVLFNYQSRKNNPAVLTILCTREGASVTIIDNKRDAFKAGRTWGQRLFFNKNGERASLTGKRMSDFLKDQKSRKGQDGKVRKSMSEKEKAGLNMVLLIQVPLKHKAIPMLPYAAPGGATESAPMPTMKTRRSDVENAVIGHGKVEGPFTEIDGLKIERDERFPIRVTIQFYKATSNGMVNQKDMAEIASQITKVYADADYVGSLVVGGETGRPTEYYGSKKQPKGWWEAFWKQYEKEHGQSRYEAIRMLRKILGPYWEPKSRKDLEKQLKKLEKNKK